jgi:hypothetical protein
LRNKVLFNGQSEAEKLETVIVNKDKLGFRIFFLGNEEGDVEVMEVDEVDFENIKRRLENGESIFLSRIQQQESKPDFSINLEKDPWYFTHS